MTDTPQDGQASWIPLVITITLVQAVLALMSRTLPLFGMALTATTDMRPEAVGQLAAATSFGSMVFFLWGPTLLARVPSLRQLQLGCVTAAVGMLFCATGLWQGMLMAAFVIGLGYGPSAPAGSDLLMRITPKAQRATIFSIKQSGVPLGGLAAGLLLPAIAIFFRGLPAAIAAASLLSLAAAVALSFWKGTVDDTPPAREKPPLCHLLLAPVRMIVLLMREPRLRLITAAGFCLGVAQGVIMGFYPVFLSHHAGWTVPAAGAAFALLQGLGMIGRIAMGWVSDRLGNTVQALSGLCFASGVTMLLLATINAGSPDLWVYLLAALAGITVVSWNGVFLAGLAESAPQGRVGEITAAGTFVLFSGYVLCPLVMQSVFIAADSYAVGLILAGLAPMIAGTALLLGARR